MTENPPLLGNDSEGPRIDLSPEGDPEALAAGALWHAVISDSSGINITQLVSNRSVILQVYEGTRLAHVEDLSASVQFPQGYAEGRVEFRLPESLPGGRRYRLTLSASDNLNQGGSATKEFYLVEGAGGGLALDRIYNVPNPTDGATTFFVEMSQQAEVSSSDLHDQRASRSARFAPGPSRHPTGSRREYTGTAGMKRGLHWRMGSISTRSRSATQPGRSGTAWNGWPFSADGSLSLPRDDPGRGHSVPPGSVDTPRGGW